MQSTQGAVIYALYQGVLPMLDELKEKRPLLLYSRKGWDRKLLLEQLGISEHFSATYFVEKKTPEHLMQVVQERGLDPKACVVVGDMLTDEICVGSALGMKTVWFQQSRFGSIIGQGVGCVPDHTVSSIAELRELLRTI
jgi:HAD superfamily hydrolase (TIGR01509 family)